VTVVPAVTPLTDFGTWVRGKGLEIVLFVLGAMLLVRLIHWAADRITSRIDAASAPDDPLVRSEASKHRHTIAQALRWLATGLIWAVTVALVLDRFGVPFTRLAVPATVVGVALGVGAQQVVKDLIGGIFIIAEHQYGFGDMVRISGGPSTDGATGVIEDITLRITRVRTPDGEVVMIPNGQVLQVTNLSRDWARAVVDVPLAVGVDVARANEVLRRVGASAFEDQKLRPLLLDAPTVMGVESFEPGQVNIRMVARTLPGKQFEVARTLRARVAMAFQREGIGGSVAAATEPPVADEA
jgi:moderate conductance mechanosensitive channel